MKVIIRTSGRKTIDYIVDCLSGNYGWEPIGTIEPQIVSRFIYQLVTLSKEADLYDIVLTDDCRLETKSDHVTIRYREHLATLDRADFERIDII